MSKKKMTPSEALVETLVAEGVREAFGIVGSAYMDALDLFPAAGIRFISVAHEQAACHAADGLARVTGRPQTCIAQNGPGAANFVSALTAAYWAHSPVVAITPETGSMGIGTGGFQELDQMPMFERQTIYQVRVNRPERMAELTRRVFTWPRMKTAPPSSTFPGTISTVSARTRSIPPWSCPTAWDRGRLWKRRPGFWPRPNTRSSSPAGASPRGTPWRRPRPWPST